MNPPVILYYIGGGQYLAGVPGRDLPLDEVEALGLDPAVLITSGCYSYLPPAPAEYVAPSANIFTTPEPSAPEPPLDPEYVPLGATYSPEEGAA